MLAVAGLALSGLPGHAAVAVAAASNEPDRTVLPLAEPPVTPITEIDARKATAPARFEVKAPPCGTAFLRRS